MYAVVDTMHPRELANVDDWQLFVNCQGTATPIREFCQSLTLTLSLTVATIIFYQEGEGEGAR